MAVIHITESELARDIGSFLDQVQAGAEIAVERNDSSVAVLHGQRKPRLLSEMIASMDENSTARLDSEFAADLMDVINRNREPLAAPD